MNPIILEGSDASGKTTLARELEKCGYTYIHNGPPELGASYLMQLHEVSEPTVFDRFHIGETIYGPLLRGKSIVTNEDWIELDDKIEKMGGIIVICLPEWRQVLDCWAERKAKEHIQDYGKLRDSYRQYQALLDVYDNYLHYDYNRFTAASFAEALTCLRSR